MITLRAWLTLLRLKQWLKNLFVAIPLFFSGELFDPAAVRATTAVFILFCLTSSAVYILNDYKDREADAAHPKKSKRPLASGAVSSREALLLIAVLAVVATAFFVTSDLPASVAAIVMLYVLVNLSYSFGLKHVSLLELFLVASGFVLRLLAGGMVLQAPLSSWLLAMTGVVAMLIVTAKRRAEIAEGYDRKYNRRSLRSYNLAFLDSTMSMLAGMTIVFYLLFATSGYATERYGERALLFTAPIVGFGILRFVQVTKVFNGADDPTELIIRDPGIVIPILLFAASFAVILYS